MEPNPQGPVDRDVSVVRFVKSDGTDKGILFHYSCHPTTSADNMVSSEYPGAAMDVLQAAAGSGVPVSFVQGCCGDIRPALLHEGSFYRGTAKDADRFGEELAGVVRTILQSDMRPIPAARLVGRSCSVALPCARVASEDELLAAAKEDGYRGQWANLLLQDPERNTESVSLDMTLLQLAEGFGLFAMNGEIVVDYGLFIKELSAQAIWPLGYSNGMIGYVPTASQVREGGYEGGESAPYFGLPSAFSPELESGIKTAIRSLIGNSGRDLGL